MPTIEALPSTNVKKGEGYSQTPIDATDFDGYKELGLYVNVQNVQAGGSTLTVTIGHAARNRDADYLPLFSWTGITSSDTTFSDQNDFMRFLRVKAEWANGNTTTTADVEVLAVPKR